MSTTYYDPRAERTVAAAEAEQRRAEAAATLARVELQRVEVEAARAKLADRQEQAAEARRQQHRQHARADRAARWAGIRAALANGRRVIASAVPALAGGVAMGAPILIGWYGQLETARTVLHLACWPGCSPPRSRVAPGGWLSFSAKPFGVVCRPADSVPACGCSRCWRPA